MPESGIGLFPDVGAGWWLSRLQGKVGLWLALTGAKIRGPDCVALGLATHYVESHRLEELKAALAANPTEPGAVLRRFAMDPPTSDVDGRRAEIDRLFDSDSVEGVLERLAADHSPTASETLAILATKSPQSMKVAFRQLELAASAESFADEMRIEYRLAARIVRRSDFKEGVRAVIVDKDNAPRWNPATLEDVTEELLDELFAPLPPDKEWTPLPGV
jgi:enoyl-CoA hydratase